MKSKFYIITIILFCSIASFSQAPNWLWAKNAVGTGNMAYSVAVDALGNAYVLGVFEDATITFGSYTLTNAGYGYTGAMFLVKFNTNGNVVWAKSADVGYDGAGTFAISADGSGNTYVTGYYTGSTITFDTITLTNNTAGLVSDMFLTKFDANGNVIWAKSADGVNGGGNKSNTVTVDSLSNVYVAGYFDSPNIIFGSTTLTVNTVGGDNIFLVKYDKNGNVLWAKSSKGGTTNDEASSVAVDVSGNIYVAGSFDSPIISFGSYTFTNNHSDSIADIFLVKYNSNGNVVWAKSIEGQMKWFYDYFITVDYLGNIYMTGDFYSSNITFGAYTLINDSSGYTDIFITKYDSSGNVLWAKSAGGTGNDHANTITVDASENAYLAGWFASNTMTFDLSQLINTGDGGNDNIFLAKYNVNGNVIWAKSVGGTHYDDRAYSITIDASNEAYVAGGFSDSSITFGSTSLTTAVTYGSPDMFLAKLSASTGINELNNSLNIKVYPNPVSETVTIDASASLSIPMAIEITNIEGQLIKTLITSGNKTDVNVSSFPKGMYFVKVETESGMTVEKFVKE
jgi:hypothetical protein